MDNEKDDNYYVEKIKTDLEFVIAHTKGKTMELWQSFLFLLKSF